MRDSVPIVVLGVSVDRGWKLFASNRISRGYFGKWALGNIFQVLADFLHLTSLLFDFYD